ncbi:MAG: copper chaperone PCu(A)C [Croceibacterium sp.]
MKSAIWPALALALATQGLVACGQDQAEAPAAAKALAGIAVTNGRLALPPVKGNPGAVYFDIANTGAKDVAFRSAEVAGAKSAMLHSVSNGVMQDVMVQPVKAGETLHFAPGDKHIMALGLDDTLKPGGTTDVVLHFSTGEKVTFPATILAPGDKR